MNALHQIQDILTVNLEKRVNIARRCYLKLNREYDILSSELQNTRQWIDHGQYGTEAFKTELNLAHSSGMERLNGLSSKREKALKILISLENAYTIRYYPKYLAGLFAENAQGVALMSAFAPLAIHPAIKTSDAPNLNDAQKKALCRQYVGLRREKTLRLLPFPCADLGDYAVTYEDLLRYFAFAPCRPKSREAQQKGLVAFNAHPDDLLRPLPRATTCRPGKLLRRIFPQAPATLIRKLTHSWRIELGCCSYELISADYPEAWREVYQDRKFVSTCMSGMEVVTAYACNRQLRHAGLEDSPLALAVMRDCEGFVLARAIVHTRRRAFVSVYGKSEWLGRALIADGFECDEDAFAGCYLAANYEGEDAYSAPYVDGLQNADLCDHGLYTFWLLTPNGEHKLSKTDGYIEVKATKCCIHCDQVHDEYDFREVFEPLADRNNTRVYEVCTYCAEDTDYVYGHIDMHGNNGYMHVDDAVESTDGNYVIRLDDVAAANGYVWLENGQLCPESDACTCVLTGDCVHQDEARYLPDGSWVSKNFSVAIIPQDRKHLDADTALASNAHCCGIPHQVEVIIPKPERSGEDFVVYAQQLAEIYGMSAQEYGSYLREWLPQEYTALACDVLASTPIQTASDFVTDLAA